ncbi:hypothetical protein [Paraherbaspirillum soli]|uniref:Uncharacterized protein n=1 Tax=Paraherbaspirillum soli TaxID=631222 RepID=A0ABW0MD78_9BURK
MTPWMWFWAPQLHLPFSGNLAQQIEPNTDWFFNGIQPKAGNADVEKQAFNIASYGKQLGLLTEVLLSIADAESVDPKKAAESLARLKEIRQKIEDLKSENAAKPAEAAVALLDKLRADDRQQFDIVLQRYTARPET